MGLSFLPYAVKSALNHLNNNYLTEIRLRRGQPVIVEYCGEYQYLGNCGLSAGVDDRVVIGDINCVLNDAVNGCIYGFVEQMKNGFITVGHGVRIGLAGEYVTQNGSVTAIKNVTSLNIRVPHDIVGCSDFIFEKLYRDSIKSTLIFSKPGMGKTTMLRDIARKLSMKPSCNVLVFDERGEISAMDAYGEGFDLGCADVIRFHNKIDAVKSAIRAMKPNVIITDELYGTDDVEAVSYAADCGIAVIASSHIMQQSILKTMPFEFFVRLEQVNGLIEIYDKNFNLNCDNGVDNCNRGVSLCEQKEENAGV